MQAHRFILAANWKLNKTPEDVPVFFREFLQAIEALPSRKKTAEVIIFPPHLLAGALQQEFKNLQNSAAYPFFSLNWGGQNCYAKASGAFTGETSATTLARMGARFVLIGHSERRTIFGEMDSLISEKVLCAQTSGLTPLLCIGETLQERKSGETQNVLGRQLKENLKSADFQKPLVIAYEPVWAIGTGVVASVEQVQETHGWIRTLLAELTPAATDLPILYGGSVSTENHKQLRQIPNVNGFLVGGASLKGDSFAQLLSDL
jgi:triosephosphate isomerase